jgi:hypothetical protein
MCAWWYTLQSMSRMQVKKILWWNTFMLWWQLLNHCHMKCGLVYLIMLPIAHATQHLWYEIFILLWHVQQKWLFHLFQQFVPSDTIMQAPKMLYKPWFKHSANEQTHSPFETLSVSKYIKILFLNLTDLLTYYMEQNPSWKGNQFTASQKTPHILQNPKVHYCIHKCPPPVRILSYFYVNIS